MKPEEALVKKYLIHRGYTDVRYEPCGRSAPPDFLVNDRIAVEVRRLNQSHGTPGNLKGLETEEWALRSLIKKVIKLLDPPKVGFSWDLDYHFRRPIATGEKNEEAIRKILTEFMKEDTHKQTVFSVNDSIDLKLSLVPESDEPFYIMGSEGDDDAYGWTIPVLQKNTQFCINEKTKKIAKCQSKYAEWWLILVDHIICHPDDLKEVQLRGQVSIGPEWNRIILVNPTDPTRSFVFHPHKVSISSVPNPMT